MITVILGMLWLGGVGLLSLIFLGHTVDGAQLEGDILRLGPRLSRAIAETTDHDPAQTPFPRNFCTVQHTSTKMAPKGKKVERKEENISLGPQIRDGAYVSDSADQKRREPRMLGIEAA